MTPLAHLFRRLRREPVRELYRLVRYGPRLYRASRRIGMSRRHAIAVVLVP